MLPTVKVAIKRSTSESSNRLNVQGAAQYSPQTPGGTVCLLAACLALATLSGLDGLKDIGGLTLPLGVLACLKHLAVTFSGTTTAILPVTTENKSSPGFSLSMDELYHLTPNLGIIWGLLSLYKTAKSSLIMFNI